MEEDNEVREEDAEATEEALEPDLSGFTGFFLGLPGEGDVGEIPLGDSVGVPL